jgi:ribosome-associated protein
MTEPPMAGPAPDPSTVLAVAAGVAIPLRELTWRFSTSGGPGGQHVNTSNTRSEVRFDAESSPSLPDWARERILERLGPVVVATASDERSQARNRAAALDRLAARLAQALEEAPPRTPTRPTTASQQRRLDSKRRQSQRKRDRRVDRGADEPE